MRTETERDAKGVADARTMLDVAYGWLEEQAHASSVGGRQYILRWRIAPLPRRFSMRIGCIQSAIDFRRSRLPRPASCPAVCRPRR